jgi:hypothetical protein
MLLALGAQAISIGITCVFHSAYVFVFGWLGTLPVIMGVILLDQWVRILALFDLEKLLSFP